MVITVNARMRAATALMLGAMALAGCSASGGGAAGAGLAQRGDQGDRYRLYASQMVEAGRFRTEAAPSDAPYGPAELLSNFEKVAFVPERQLASYYENQEGSRRLSKWTRSFSLSLTGDAIRDEDRRALAAHRAVLERRSGLRISDAAEPTQADMTVFIMSPEARRLLAEDAPMNSGFSRTLLQEWATTLNPPCFAVFRTSGPTGGAIERAAVFIKGELESPLREACIVEETTQSLGLLFDHDDVRPSIFNDDQEFIALTRHDERLISILYDPRLRAGMSRSEARPKLVEIIGESATN